MLAAPASRESHSMTRQGAQALLGDRRASTSSWWITTAILLGPLGSVLCICEAWVFVTTDVRAPARRNGHGPRGAPSAPSAEVVVVNA
ncbi:MAG: hypothetical protein R2716_00510 [Microthrixaceae bacterium]